MKNIAKSELFRELPSVDELMRNNQLSGFIEENGAAAVTDAARAVVARLRREIASGLVNAHSLRLALDGVNGAIEQELLRELAYSLRPVINATGVILHTNLGRAPLAQPALEHIAGIAGVYSNLEFEVDSGGRGKRDVHVERLFQRLLNRESGQIDDSTGLRPAGTGAAPVATRTIVVNNNAAAVLLALNSLAEGGEVVVSRGELVEIGGSFRIPDVMSKSGAILREVGTTNRTRIVDYENAIQERTRLLLRVHRSNFEISGFTEQPSITELCDLARRRGLPLMEDLGSGALVSLENFGVRGEPNVLDSLGAGADIVTYSGDKLLGGPQAGLISGRADLVARMRSNSLFRAVRVDKLTFAALEATLFAYVKRDYDTIPAFKMMRLTAEEIGNRAQEVAKHVQSPKLKSEIVDGESVIGGGAAPSSLLPTRLLALTCEDLSADQLASWLRGCNPPIIARVEEGRVLLDLRTVLAEQDRLISEALARIAA